MDGKGEQMSDCMTFPDTVEEFMDQYKIIDTKQVYTNGIEFVPIFRMKQWFEHLPSVQPEDCGTCKHGYFGDEQCNGCRVRFTSHYERRTDERQT